MASEGKHQIGENPNDRSRSPAVDEGLSSAISTASSAAGNDAVQPLASTTGDGQTETIAMAAVGDAASPTGDLAILPEIAADTSKARLRIMEEPRQRGFRFRYSCEGPSHGGLPGETSEKNRKSYPTVQLDGYAGRAARVVVSLVTQDDPPRPHAHSLVGRHVVNGQCTVQVGPETNWMASFPNLGILHVTKKNVVKVLLERYALALSGPGASSIALPIMPGTMAPGAVPAAPQADEEAVIAASMDRLSEEERSQLKSMAEEASRHMNLSVVRLCFQAYLADDTGSYTKPLQPCISQPVYDSKAPSASTLKICRMDRHSGSVLGGDELYLLCDRVQKDDIEVRFFTEADGEEGGDAKESWCAQGCFAPSDVHRQFAIVFKTPAYCDTGISRPVNVWIQLRRRSDGETSEAKPFTYQPQVVDTEQLARKRMKKIPHFFDHYGETPSGSRNGSNGGGGGPSGGAGGGSRDPMWGSTGPGGGAAGGGSGNTAAGGGGGFLAGFGFNGMPGLSGRKAALDQEPSERQDMLATVDQPMQAPAQFAATKHTQKKRHRGPKKNLPADFGTRQARSKKSFTGRRAVTNAVESYPATTFRHQVLSEDAASLRKKLRLMCAARRLASMMSVQRQRAPQKLARLIRSERQDMSAPEDQPMQVPAQSATAKHTQTKRRRVPKDRLPADFSTHQARSKKLFTGRRAVTNAVESYPATTFRHQVLSEDAASLRKKLRLMCAARRLASMMSVQRQRAPQKLARLIRSERQDMSAPEDQPMQVPAQSATAKHTQTKRRRVPKDRLPADFSTHQARSKKLFTGRRAVTNAVESYPATTFRHQVLSEDAASLRKKLRLMCAACRLASMMSVQRKRAPQGSYSTNREGCRSEQRPASPEALQCATNG